MNLGTTLARVLATLAAPEAVTLIDLIGRVGPELAHSLADTPPADLAALRARLAAVPIVVTDEAIEEGRRLADDDDQA